MSESYLVKLPNGQQRGPFTREVLLEVARDGGLPLAAEVQREGEASSTLTVESFLAQNRNTGSAKRLSAEERARLGGTQAATPHALASRFGADGQPIAPSKKS